MLSLTRELDQEMVTADGRVVGRVTDLTVRLDRDGARRVARLVVDRTGAGVVLVPWDEVATFGHDRVVLRPDTASTTGPDDRRAALGDLHHDELLLRRDVLDTQIVDVVGRRLARVGDVVLTRGADDELELVGVEVGFGSVLRRLGLGRLATSDDVVAWSDLHLTSERGHQVQLGTPRAAVHHLDAAGLAALVSRLSTESAAEVLVAAGPERAAAALEEAHPAVGERILRAMPDEHVDAVVGALPAERSRRLRDRLARHRPLRGRSFLRSMVRRARRIEHRHLRRREESA